MNYYRRNEEDFTPSAPPAPTTTEPTTGSTPTFYSPEHTIIYPYRENFEGINNGQFELTNRTVATNTTATTNSPETFTIIVNGNRRENENEMDICGDCYYIYKILMIFLLLLVLMIIIGYFIR